MLIGDSRVIRSAKDTLADISIGMGILSVATAIADIFRNNGISMGRNLAKILKVFEKIYEAKSRGVISGT
jgi:hypothetical protein